MVAKVAPGWGDFGHSYKKSLKIKYFNLAKHFCHEGDGGALGFVPKCLRTWGHLRLFITSLRKLIKPVFPSISREI